LKESGGGETLTAVGIGSRFVERQRRKLGHRWVCPAAEGRSKVHLFGQRATACLSVLTTANAGQCATSNCKLLVFWFPRKR